MANNDRETSKLLYAYAYNRENDVYTVRGIIDWEVSYVPREITRVPKGLLNQITAEFARESNLEESELNPTVSLADDGSGAVVDFYDRVFSTDQVKTIMESGFVSKPQEPKKAFTKKIGSIFQKKNNLTSK